MAENPQENVPESSKSVKELTASDYNCKFEFWNIFNFTLKCLYEWLPRKLMSKRVWFSNFIFQM